jgi:nicotinamide-nucleotide amidase
MAAAVRSALGSAVFGEGDELTLEEVVAAEIAARGLSIATAESCTGGLVAERLTRVPGSSGWFPGGVVAYSNEQKVTLLGVDSDLIVRYGAVSREVVEAMAEGVRVRLGSALGVAVSGIAGPGGGSEEKPVGTVHLALAGPGDALRHRGLKLLGDRLRIRQLASQVALEMVRRALLGIDREAPR